MLKGPVADYTCSSESYWIIHCVHKGCINWIRVERKVYLFHLLFDKKFKAKDPDCVWTCLKCVKKWNLKSICFDDSLENFVCVHNVILRMTLLDFVLTSHSKMFQKMVSELLWLSSLNQIHSVNRSELLVCSQLTHWSTQCVLNWITQLVNRLESFLCSMLTPWMNHFLVMSDSKLTWNYYL